MKADIEIKPVIKLIPKLITRFEKIGYKFTIKLNWLCFNIEIDNH